MSIVDNENKEMLWDLIIDICNDNSFQVNGEELKNFLDNRCMYYHGQRFEFPDLNLKDINEKIIGQCYNFILSKQPRKNTVRNTTIQKPSVTKQDAFEKNLAEKQKAFEDGINLKKPKEIDFSDGGKDFPMGNLDIIMNQTLADRQKELQQITSSFSKEQQEEASKWLNNGETPKIKIEKTSNLKLDNTITNLALLDKKQRAKIERRVRFEVNENTDVNPVTNFFSKLKVKNENNDIIDKLDKIISNQEIIIKILKKEEENEDIIPSYEAI